MGLAVRVGLGVLAVMGVLGCSKAPVTPPAEVVIVGPAPLRRLSNSEYLNALHDLFPEVSAELPALPAETVIGGLENDVETQRPSDVLIARYEEIANTYAHALVSSPERYRALLGCDPTAEGCAERFITTTGRRIYRRPLNVVETGRLTTAFAAWQKAVDFQGATQLTLSAMLQSPQFIYRAEPQTATPDFSDTAPIEPYAMASRLSFFLWESSPDEELLRAAAANELRTAEQISAQAERMLKDARVQRVYWNFHRQWLGLDRILQDEQAVKTPAVEALWSPATQVSALEESKQLIAHELFENGSLRTLLTSRRAWVDGEMARLYNVPPPLDPKRWAPVELDGSQRSGLLSRVAFLAGTSHRGATSPPIRANAIQLRMLCQYPRPPPAGLDTTPPAQPATGAKTNRALFEERTAATLCQGCHTSLNGLGFGLEHYNAAGVYQSTDQGLAVDASGKLQGTDIDQPFDGAIALGEALSQSQQLHLCATQMWLRYALGRALVDEEGPWLADVSQAFFARKGDVRSLLVDIAVSPTFRLRRTGATAP